MSKKSSLPSAGLTLVMCLLGAPVAFGQQGSGLVAAQAPSADAAASQVVQFVRTADRLCDPARMSGRDYPECLRKAQEESERQLLALMSSIHGVVDKAPGTQGAQRARWKRALDDAQALWVRFRNAECQEVSPFEATNKNRLSEEQRACILEHNARRAEELRRRYPGA
jgi:uncharacterized protein YecT (DUF1311 family)